MQRSGPLGKTSVALFGFLLSVYVLTLNGFFAGYGMQTFLATENLCLRRSYSLSQESVRRIDGFLLENPFPAGEQELRPPLQAVLQVPFYGLGWVGDQILFDGEEKHARVLLVLAFQCVITALQAVLLFDLLRLMGLGERKALLFALLYGLSTMAFPYSSLGMEPLMILTLMAAYYFLYRFARERHDRHAVLAGISAGAMVISKTYAALFLLPLTVYLLAILWFSATSRTSAERFRAAVRPAASFFAPSAAGVALLMVDNFLKRGGFGDSGYAIEYGLEYIPRNLLALLAGSGSSIFLYNPVCLLAIPAFAYLVREHRRESWGIAALIAVPTAYFCSLAPPMTFHDEVYGPRYLLPLAPFLIMTAAFWPLGSIARRSCVVILGLAGFGIQLVMKPFHYGNHTALLVELGRYNQDNADFVPALSPIAMNWALLRSMWNRVAGDGAALELGYQPSFLPHLQAASPSAATSVSLTGYDTIDLFWLWAREEYGAGASIWVAALLVLAAGFGGYLVRVLRDAEGASVTVAQARQSE